MLTTKNSGVLRFSAAFLVCGWIVLPGCTPSGPRALLEGERLIHAGKFSQAVRKLQRATELLPGNAQAWNHLGLAYHRAGRAEDARRAYEQALRRNPNLAAARYNLGCLFLEQQQPEIAVSEFTTYTLLQRRSPQGWLKLGTAQLRTGRWDAAERSFQNALRLQPNLPEALNGLGIVQTQRRHFREATESFSAALQQQPGYAPPLLNLAILYDLYLGNHPFALRKYREYLALHPAGANAPAVKETIRRLQAELAPPPPPKTTPPASVPTPAPPPTHSTPIVAAGGHQASAPDKTASPLLAQRSATDAAHTSASDEVRAPAPSPAHEPPRKSEPPPLPAPSTQLVASPRPQTPKPEPEPPPKTELVPVANPSQPKLAQDISPPPSQPSPASARTNATPPTRAAAVPNRRVEEAQAPQYASAPRERLPFVQRLNPATWFRTRERPAPAPTLLPVPASTRRTTGLPPTNRSSPATATSKAAPPSTKPQPPIRRYAYHSPPAPAAGDRFQAQPLLAQGVESHREDRVGEALKAYQDAARLDPSFFEAYYNVGLAQFELKNIPAALSAYETALSLNPTSANARYNFALALKQGGYLIDAALELEKLLETHPEEAKAHFLLAGLYAEQLDKPALARLHYRKVLELDPHHAQAPAIRFWLAAHR